METLAEAGGGAPWLVFISAVLLGANRTFRFILLLDLCREVVRKADGASDALSLADVALLVLALRGRRSDVIRELREQLASAKKCGESSESSGEVRLQGAAPRADVSAVVPLTSGFGSPDGETSRIPATVAPGA